MERDVEHNAALHYADPVNTSSPKAIHVMYQLATGALFGLILGLANQSGTVNPGSLLLPWAAFFLGHTLSEARGATFPAKNQNSGVFDHQHRRSAAFYPGKQLLSSWADRSAQIKSHKLQQDSRLGWGGRGFGPSRLSRALRPLFHT